MNQKYRKYLIKQKQNYMILFTIIMAIPFPAFVTIRLLTQNFSNMEQEILADSHVLVMAVMATLLAILTPFLMFHYKNSKKSIDLYHSFPITRKELLKNHLFVGWLILFVSTSIAYWSGYSILYFFNHLAYHSDHIFRFIRLILMLSVIMMPSVFVIMNTGTLVDSLLYTGIITVLPFLAYSAFNIFSSEHILGFAPYKIESLRFTSPFVAMFQIIGFSQDIDPKISLFYWLFIAGLLYWISQKLYQKWPSESSETPLSNPVFYPFISTVSTFIVLVFLIAVIAFPSNTKIPFLSIQNLILPFLITYGFYTTLTMVKERSANALKKASKHFIVIFLITIAFLSIYRQSLGFGAYKKIYHPSELDSIFIQANNNSPSFLPLQEGYQLQEKSEQEIVLEFQRKVLEEYQKGSLPMPRPYDYENTQIILEFKKNNGRKIRRSYTVPFDLVTELEDLKKQQAVFYKNHPILNPNYDIKTLRISDDLITKEYAFTGDWRQLQKHLRNDMKTIELDENSPNILYHLFYEDKIRYQFPLDKRFVETLQYLEENIQPLRSLESEYIFIPKTNISANSLGYMTFTQQIDINWPESTLDLSPSEIHKYRGKLKSRNIDHQKHDSLMIISEGYQTILPLET